MQVEQWMSPLWKTITNNKSSPLASRSKERRKEKIVSNEIHILWDNETSASALMVRQGSLLVWHIKFLVDTIFCCDFWCLFLSLFSISFPICLCVTKPWKFCSTSQQVNGEWLPSFFLSTKLWFHFLEKRTEKLFLFCVCLLVWMLHTIFSLFSKSIYNLGHCLCVRKRVLLFTSVSSAMN